MKYFDSMELSLTVEIIWFSNMTLPGHLMYRQLDTQSINVFYVTPSTLLDIL